MVHEVLLAPVFFPQYRATCGLNRGIAIIGTVAIGVSASKGKHTLGFDVNHRDTDTAYQGVLIHAIGDILQRRRQHAITVRAIGVIGDTIRYLLGGCLYSGIQG